MARLWIPLSRRTARSQAARVPCARIRPMRSTPVKAIRKTQQVSFAETDNAERIDLGSHHRLDRWVARGKSDEGPRLRRADGHCTRNRRRRDRPLRVWGAGAI